MNSAAKAVTLFPKMFKDSTIANNIALQKTKISYYVMYGLCPYFESELETLISKCNYFVAGFDEALNKVTQKGQMDICLRFFTGKNVVTQ